MKTIAAKELRTNLDEIVRRVRGGETMRVTYRSQPAFILQPEKPKKAGPTPGSPAAMKLFLASAETMRKSAKKTVLDPNKSIKELYHEMLDNDPKYKPPYHR